MTSIKANNPIIGKTIASLKETVTFGFVHSGIFHELENIRWVNGNLFSGDESVHKKIKTISGISRRWLTLLKFRRTNGEIVNFMPYVMKLLPPLLPASPPSEEEFVPYT